ncbi:MAG TPA: UDP-N-acetylglucosamine 1-carboxyvinyltransferase [Alphaproteobacteria bacterium]|nr:UDP-N-acetylglucosamine 1-carboxyvinyltransferase [Alphaproteobacteria bacterium]
MDKIVIKGGKPLSGIIPISGAKNAALPIMAASILTDQTLTLTNVPHLADITTMANLLRPMGVEIGIGARVNDPHGGHTMELTAREIVDSTAPYDFVRKMRASVFVLGPLLARVGEAKVSLPGGCAIGARPVDLHCQGLEQMGAIIDLDGGYINATAPKGLSGARIVFPKVSVGATENLMMAASIAKGETQLINAAAEPEVVDLANCLNAMGADIEGAGTNIVTIRGVPSLHGANYRIIPDRIETGTYAIAVAVTGGRVELVGARMDHVSSLMETLSRAGVDVSETEEGLSIARLNGIKGVDIMTEPFPGFPTDLQAQAMSLMTVAEGAAMITETIFENRFMHVPELARMGANITVHHGSALVRGVDKLRGAPVMATDLRASVSLVVAALAAEGETIINRVYHLDRGYERLEEKLAACGADVTRVREAD